MKTARFRWLLPLLRYGLCAVALVYLVATVDWYDHIRLNDAGLTRVRLLAEHPGEFVIEQDGQPRTIPDSGVHDVQVDGRSMPDIERGIASVVRTINVTYALLAILIFAPVPLLVSVRLVWMLAIQQVRLSIWNATKLTFAGEFFNFALPGTTGGDLIKAYYVSRFTHRKTEAVTTIFLDRVIGLLSLVLMAGAMLVFIWDPRHFGRLGLILGVTCAGLAVAGLFFFSRRLRHALRLPQLAAWLPAGDHILRVGRATLAMREHKVLVTLALLITFVLQAIALVSGVVMAWALGMQGDFSWFFVYIAVGWLIAAIPIAPPQAIGVMEVAYIQFFTSTGLNTDSQAVALALAVRLIKLVWALPGILVPLLGAHLPSKTELAALEDAAESTGPFAPPSDPPAAAEACAAK